VEIAVCLKRVPDTAEADVKVDATGKDIVRDKLAFTINEADNYALEEALLAKEKHNANVTLVSVGAIASDDGNSQVGPALAELLGLPHAAYVTKLDIQAGKALVKRELEGGFLEVKELATPCVVTIQTGGNTPRYASIMGIKRAGAKPIEQAAPAKSESKTSLIKVYVPEIVGAAQMFEGTVDEKALKMAQLLKEKGAV
jgi:electron transfer flavoprotein beta subunit